MPSPPPFLDALVSRGEEPLLRDVSGSIRFDLRHGTKIDPWTLSIADGTVSISHRKLAADCIATMDDDTFRSIASGRINAYAAALRGDIEISGDPALLLAFQRVFPGPPGDERRTSETTGASR
jgi:putative sterol carrier protein